MTDHFDMSAINVTDASGLPLPLLSLRPATKEDLLMNTGYYGALSKRDNSDDKPERRQAFRGMEYVGQIQGPNVGNIQVSVPSGVVCPKNVCNMGSNIVNIGVNPKPPPCVIVKITTPKVVLGVNLLEAQVAFSSDLNGFDTSMLKAYGYSVANRTERSVALDKSLRFGGPRTFAVSVVPSSQDHLELWLPANAIKDNKGVYNCESNHEVVSHIVSAAPVISSFGHGLVGTDDIPDGAITNRIVAKDAVWNNNVHDGVFVLLFCLCHFFFFCFLFSLSFTIFALLFSFSFLTYLSLRNCHNCEVERGGSGHCGLAQ